MTLSKYTDNLYQSEVYRELERQAVKKGFFKPTDSELIKLAAQEVEQTRIINQEVDASPSEDLIVDVARLAYAMRRKGLIVQAEDLEKKLVMFKQAENAFYNVTQETNKDLINFAHRDGDVNLIEGSGDLGTFETMQSIADKILAVTRKEPTGKQAMNRLATLASMINKVAQEGGAPGYYTSSQGGAPQGGPAASEAAPQQSISPITSTVSRETPKTRRAILANVQTTLEEFDTARKSAPSLDAFILTDPAGTEQQAAYIYFARLAGIQVNPRSITSWNNVAQVAVAEGVLTQGEVPAVTAEALYTKLQNAHALIPTAQVDTLRKISTAIGIGQVFESTYMNPNNDSSYIFAGGIQFATNNDNAWAACQWLAQQVRAVYVSAFGENNDTIVKAQTVMRSLPERLYTELNAIKTGDRLTDVSTALRQLIRIGKDISDALAKFSKEPTFSQMRAVNAGLIDQIVNWVNGIRTSISDQYKSMASSDQLQPFTMDTSQLEAASTYWGEQTQSEDIDVAKKAVNISNKIQQLKEIIDEYQNKPWVELQEALSDMGIDAPNKNIFLSSVRKIVESAKGRK
jgi:hypothetical protein